MIDPIEYAWKHCNPTAPFPVVWVPWINAEGETAYGTVFTHSHLLVQEPYCVPESG